MMERQVFFPVPTVPRETWVHLACWRKLAIQQAGSGTHHALSGTRVCSDNLGWPREKGRSSKLCLQDGAEFKWLLFSSRYRPSEPGWSLPRPSLTLPNYISQGQLHSDISDIISASQIQTFTWQSIFYYSGSEPTMSVASLASNCGSTLAQMCDLRQITLNFLVL